MSDLAVEVTELRGRVDQLRDEQARAEARVSAAEEEEARLLVSLKSEFGVGSIGDAEALLTQLDMQIMAEMSAIRAQLDQTS